MAFSSPLHVDLWELGLGGKMLLLWLLLLLGAINCPLSDPGASSTPPASLQEAEAGECASLQVE